MRGAGGARAGGWGVARHRLADEGVEHVAEGGERAVDGYGLLAPLAHRLCPREPFRSSEVDEGNLSTALAPGAEQRVHDDEMRAR